MIDINDITTPIGRLHRKISEFPKIDVLSCSREIISVRKECEGHKYFKTSTGALYEVHETYIRIYKVESNGFVIMYSKDQDIRLLEPISEDAFSILKTAFLNARRNYIYERD